MAIKYGDNKLHPINEDIWKTCIEHDLAEGITEYVAEEAYSYALSECDRSDDEGWDAIYDQKWDETLDKVMDKIRRHHTAIEGDYDGSMPEWVVEGDYPYVCHAVSKWQEDTNN